MELERIAFGAANHMADKVYPLNFYVTKVIFVREAKVIITHQGRRSWSLSCNSSLLRLNHGHVYLCSAYGSHPCDCLLIVSVMISNASWQSNGDSEIWCLLLSWTNCNKPFNKPSSCQWFVTTIMWRPCDGIRNTALGALNHMPPNVSGLLYLIKSVHGFVVPYATEVSFVREKSLS